MMINNIVKTRSVEVCEPVVLKGQYYYHTQTGHTYIVHKSYSGNYSLVSLVNGVEFTKETSDINKILNGSIYFELIKPGTKITIKVKKPKE